VVTGPGRETKGLQICCSREIAGRVFKKFNSQLIEERRTMHRRSSSHEQSSAEVHGGEVLEPRSGIYLCDIAEGNARGAELRDEVVGEGA